MERRTVTNTYDCNFRIINNLITVDFGDYLRLVQCSTDDCNSHSIHNTVLLQLRTIVYVIWQAYKNRVHV